jgi:hypothetical protein
MTAGRTVHPAQPVVASARQCLQRSRCSVISMESAGLTGDKSILPTVSNLIDRWTRLGADYGGPTDAVVGCPRPCWLGVPATEGWQSCRGRQWVRPVPGSVHGKRWSAGRVLLSDPAPATTGRVASRSGARRPQWPEPTAPDDTVDSSGRPFHSIVGSGHGVTGRDAIHVVSSHFIALPPAGS